MPSCSRVFVEIKWPLISLKPTRSDRGWVVMPFGKNPWWMYLASFIPALLVTILIFMDQQISAVIVNRKENKLKVCYLTLPIISEETSFMKNNKL